MTKKTLSKGSDYAKFLSEIKDRIREAQYSALRSVNKELIGLYWDLGKKIVEKQEVCGWGKSVVETLAKDLQKEYPGIRGFSSQNLWYMRQFFLNYRNNSKLQPLAGEISWAKGKMALVFIPASSSPGTIASSSRTRGCSSIFAQSP